MTTLIDKYNTHNAFGRLMDMHFNVITDGTVEYYLTIQPQHLATPHAAHGGVIAAIVDGALGTAGLSLSAKENEAVSTVEFKLNYLAPALLGDEIVAKATVDRKGKSFLVISCDVFCTNRDNKLIAKALGTFNTYSADKAGY